MPLVDSSYVPPRLLRWGHGATLVAALLPGQAGGWTSWERLELRDGDFVDLAWRQGGARRLAILLHGLEGSVESVYMRGMAASLGGAGWDVLAWNYRGCGGVPNRLLPSYHSGETGDLRQVVEHAARGYERMALVGFSLGGNMALKYAGEEVPHPAVGAVVAISAPVDLASSARALDERRGNRVYLQRFLGSLLAKTLAKARRFPGQLDEARLGKIRCIRTFDEEVTAPLHGFAGAEDYWARASARPHLASLGLPSLLLNALNDPLLDAPSFPEEAARENPNFFLEMPACGGHVGFHDFRGNLPPWQERRVVAFLEEQVPSRGGFGSVKKR